MNCDDDNYNLAATIMQTHQSNIAIDSTTIKPQNMKRVLVYKRADVAVVRSRNIPVNTPRIAL